jgi:transcriptional regulator with XRE-family HTH domain
MNDAGRSRFDDERLDALHRELTAEAEPDLEDVEESPEVGAVLPGLEWEMFSSTVQDYIGAVLADGESPSPQARKRMVDAASRGLAHRRARKSPLPELLAARRKERELSAASVADALGVDERVVHQMESGQVAMRELPPERIARWALLVEVRRGDVEPALRLALQRSTPASALRAAGVGNVRRLTPPDERLVSDVIAAMDATGTS